MNHSPNPSNYEWMMVCPGCGIEAAFKEGMVPGTLICNHCDAFSNFDTLKEKGRYLLKNDATKDGKQTLIREYKSVKNLQARLGNAIALAKASPENANKVELMSCLLDVRKLAEKIRADLEADIKTYGL